MRLAHGPWALVVRLLVKVVSVREEGSFSPMANNFKDVLNGLRQEILRQGGDFECSSNVNHPNPEAAHAEALHHGSQVLLQRLRFEKGLELRQEDLQVSHRAVLHWRQASDRRYHAYQWRPSAIGTLPAAPTYVGYVYWLPQVPTSGGGLGLNDARLDLMRQMVRRR